MSMKYDFTTILNREGTGAIAVSKIPFDNATIKEGFSKIPMWVADMNYATAPSVIEAIQNRLAHPVFGYFDIKDAYSESIIEWQKTRNGVTDISKEAIDYENGVLGGVSSVLQAFTAPGEAILLHSPAYIGFIVTITNMGRKIVYSPLKKDEQGVWRMDYEDMDKKLKENHIHLAIFCTPHNPCGRVWEREEIEKAMEVYEKNKCLVISDEIWSDLTLEGHKHIPTQSVNEYAHEHTFAFYAPSKTFNLAGLQTAAVYAENSILHHRMWRQLNTDEVAEPNAFAIQAAIAAFQYGEEWLDELREYVEKNKQYVTEFLQEKIPLIHPVAGDATYLMWLDCRKITESGRQFVKFIRKTSGLYVSGGNQYGRGGEGFLRVNVATSKLVVEDGMQRLYESVDAWLKEEKISK